jgi:hypothetical protein
MNFTTTVQQPQSLFDADEPETAAFPERIDVESPAGV